MLGSQAGLAAKIARHGTDEDKHGRIFTALLRKRGLEPVAAAPEADYTMRLEAAGIGLAHARLRREEELTEADIVTYLWRTAGSPSSVPASRCGRCVGMPGTAPTSPGRSG